jgi:undecaprenyl-diphosphatase
MDQKFLFLINREWAHPALDRLMAIMSSAAVWMVPLIIAGVATLIWGGFRGRAYVIVALLAFAVTDGVVGRLVKKGVGRLRPHQTEAGVRMLDLKSPAYTGLFAPLKEKNSAGTGWDQEGRSFPSNHAANTSAAALLAALFFRRWGWLAFIPAGLVAYSRVYVGSHWPTDVLGGVLLGFGTALLILAVADALWRKFGRRKFPILALRHPTLLSA